MKFFPPEFIQGFLDENQHQAVLDRYQAAITSQLSYTLQFLSGINLHDALIREVSYDKGRGVLCLKGMGGDLQGGYFCFEIIYHSVSDSCADVFAGKICEIDLHELEPLDGGRYTHRLLLITGDEAEVTFERIELNISDCDKKAYSEAWMHVKEG